MNIVYFIRVIGLMNIQNNVYSRYRQGGEQPGGIPASVFKNPMTLIPISEAHRLFEELERETGDPDFLIKAMKDFKFEQLGNIGRWMLSGHDLASTIRKINYGMSCIQSGAFWVAAPSGSIIKWTYNNSYDLGSSKVHDSIRVAVFMLKVLQRHLGTNFTPMRLMLSGNRDNTQLYCSYFNCDIGWNHHQTEIWFHSELRLATMQKEKRTRHSLAMNYYELDECLNMPQPEDETKLVYEAVNYACHFGLPTLSRVSSLFGLSEQQFQRRLHKYGLNFTELCGYVLSNYAVKLLSLSVPIDEVAQRLGYSSVDSFNHMFKKHRGMTPNQYVQRFKEDF